MATNLILFYNQDEPPSTKISTQTKTKQPCVPKPNNRYSKCRPTDTANALSSGRFWVFPPTKGYIQNPAMAHCYKIILINADSVSALSDNYDSDSVQETLKHVTGFS